MDYKPEHSRFPLIFLIMLMGLTSLACSIGGISLSANGDTIDLSLNQDVVNSMFQGMNDFYKSTQDRLLDTVSGAELHDGFIRVLGSVNKTDGSTANGSFDVSVGTADNVLVMKITAVNIPGVELKDGRVSKTNQAIADALTASVTKTNGSMLYKDASVTTTALDIKVQLNTK